MVMGIYFFTIVCLEIIFITLANKEKDKKFFKVFNGLFCGLFIAIFLYCLYFSSDVYSYDTGEWVKLSALFQSMFFFIINLIIGLIGLIFQKKSKKKLFNDTSKKGTIIKAILIVSVVSFILVFSHFIIKYSGKLKIDSEIEKETMIYLTEKYGSNDFKIVDIYRDFADNGFVSTDYLENYDIYAVYLPDNIRFYIYLDVDSSRKILKDSFEDMLISLNYSSKYFEDSDFKNDIDNAREDLNKYLTTKQLNVDIDSSKYYVGHVDDKAVPNDYGKIPSKEELYDLILDYHIKHKFEIIIDKNEIKSDDVKSELREYLIKLSNYLIDYYDDFNDYEIKCMYDGGRGKYFKGSITINKEYININVGSIKEKIKR